MKDGCENCPEYDYGDMDQLADHSTSNFSGMIAVMNTTCQESWVARWNGITNCIPGCYAVTLNIDLNQLNNDQDYDSMPSKKLGQNNDEEEEEEEDDPSGMPGKTLLMHIK